MIGIILLTILFVTGVGSILFECWKLYINQTKLKTFVVLKALPILGNLVDLLKCDGMEIFELPKRLKIKYNVPNDAKHLFTWMGPMLFMCTDHPDTYEVILNSDKAIKKAYVYGYLRNTRGILTSVPNVWKLHRRALNPTLGSKMVNTFLPIFNEKFQKMVDLMERQVDTQIDMHRNMFRSAVDSIFHASFDVAWPMQNDKSDELRNGMMEVFERVQLRSHTFWMFFDVIYKFTKFKKMDDQSYPVFHRLIESILEAKKVDLAEKFEHGYDEMAKARETNSFNYIQKCLQLRMENKFDDQDVYEEMQTIVIGSADTTALTVNTTLLMLAIHQKYQDQVVNELRSIFASVDEPVTKDHLVKMKFMELVIKEALRFFPAAPYLGREATDDIPIDGGFIPKRTQIIMNVYKSNRDPKYFGQNAHVFYPERFLPENCVNWHPYQFIPFSAGQRNW